LSAREGLLSPAEEIQLARRAQAGDEAALLRLIFANARLVLEIMKRHVGRGLEEKDLVQLGVIGLWFAALSFDWRRGLRFTTHATWQVRKEMDHAVRGGGRLVQLPPYVETFLSKLHRAEAKFTQERGHEPGPVEQEALAAAEQVTPERLRAFLAADATIVSLDAPLHDADGQGVTTTLKERVADTRSAGLWDVAETDGRTGARWRARLDALMAQALTARERRAIALRFHLQHPGRRPTSRGSAARSPLNYRSVGKRLGVPWTQAQQLVEGAVAKLQAAAQASVVPVVDGPEDPETSLRSAV
jgi:RNA polymerase primary sigma factor